MKEPRRWVNTLARQQKQTVNKGDQSLLKFVSLPSSPFSPPSLIFPSNYLFLWPLLTVLFVFLHYISVWFVFIYLILQGFFGHFRALWSAFAVFKPRLWEEGQSKTWGQFVCCASTYDVCICVFPQLNFSEANSVDYNKAVFYGII